MAAMNPSDHSLSPVRLPIGSADGVFFDVVAWGPAQADVDVSVACMFEHEVAGAAMAGGLLALDQALGGQLSRLRSLGAFRAQPMETLLVTSPPPAVAARAVLVIGLGDPAALDGETLRRATRVAMREAIRFGAQSMAFAPSVLDAGHVDNAGLDMQTVMLDGCWARCGPSICWPRRAWQPYRHCGSAASMSVRRGCRPLAPGLLRHSGSLRRRARRRFPLFPVNSVANIATMA
jgi:hypothetical protein